MRCGRARSTPLARAWRILDGWIFPRGCIICGRSSPLVLPICSTCRRRLPSFENPVCCICRQFARKDSARHECVENTPGQLNLVWAAGLLDDGYRPLVHALKYEHKPAIGEYFGRRIGRLLTTDRNIKMQRAVLVPVPLHAKREKHRGYNQSLAIATGLARRTGYPILADLLIRRRHTKDQTKLSPPQRIANVREAFSLGHQEKLTGRTVILVDDVLTTGATLNECARVIQTLEPEAIVAVVIALARPLGV